MENLRELFQSDAFMNFYEKFTIAGFWVSIPICLFIFILIVRMEKQYKAKKHEIKTMVSAPGMEDVRWLLKGRLRDYGIETDESIHEKN